MHTNKKLPGTKWWFAIGESGDALQRTHTRTDNSYMYDLSILADSTLNEGHSAATAGGKVAKTRDIQNRKSVRCWSSWALEMPAAHYIQSYAR